MKPLRIAAVVLPALAFVAGPAHAEWPKGIIQEQMTARIDAMAFDRGGECGGGGLLSGRIWAQSSDATASVIVVRPLWGRVADFVLWIDADGVWAVVAEHPPRQDNLEATEKVWKEWTEAGKHKTAGFSPVVRLRPNAVYGSPICAVIPAVLVAVGAEAAKHTKAERRPVIREPPFADGRTERRVIVYPDVAIHHEPDVMSRVLTRSSLKTEVNVTGERLGGWMRVRTDEGVEGWIGAWAIAPR